MNETTVGWTDLSLFLAVARSGGLAPASRETGRSPATLGRRMLGLERALGRELFVRHDRGYELTADGRVLLDELAEIEARILRSTAPAKGQDSPLVKISAGTWTTMLLLENLGQLRGTPPDTRLRFVASEAILDIPHRDVAIGFRIGRPTEDGLAGRRFSRVEFAAYAVKDAPDLWIRILAETPSARWVSKMVGPDAVCEVTAPRNGLDLALQGIGKVLLPTFIGDRKPKLQRRGETISELAHEQWIVTHHDDRHLPEVRRVIDRCTELLGPQRS